MKLINIIIIMMLMIASIGIVSALPLSDQQHGGNFLNIINAPPTYTINDVYYYQDVGMCKANTKCSYLYAGIPAVVYIWVDSTNSWGQKYNLYGTTTKVIIISKYHNSVIWGEGTAVFLDENTYIKVPVLVDIPLSEIGEAQAKIYQYATDSGQNIHTYSYEDFYIMSGEYGFRTIEPLPPGTIVKPRPDNRLTPRCEEIFATHLNAVKSADTNKDNKISDTELLAYINSYLYDINSMINKDEGQAVVDCWTNGCTIPSAVSSGVTTPAVTTPQPTQTTPVGTSRNNT